MPWDETFVDVSAILYQKLEFRRPSDETFLADLCHGAGLRLPRGVSEGLMLHYAFGLMMNLLQL